VIQQVKAVDVGNKPDFNRVFPEHGENFAHAFFGAQRQRDPNLIDASGAMSEASRSGEPRTV
jgi:hypothetical protein